jgi:hypothetical protein
LPVYIANPTSRAQGVNFQREADEKRQKSIDNMLLHLNLQKHDLKLDLDKLLEAVFLMN